VLSGTVKLVGTDYRRIVDEAQLLLNNPAAYNAMARVHNPYGDGQASSRIAELIHSFLTRET
jgi:UDP-N-acetylglucosamine 2-epimerase (non-hydrolysing)